MTEFTEGQVWHVPTQKKYDWLMKELEAQGYQWHDGDSLTESNEWLKNKEATCIRLHSVDEIYHARKDYYEGLGYAITEYQYPPASPEKQKAVLPKAVVEELDANGVNMPQPTNDYSLWEVIKYDSDFPVTSAWIVETDGAIYLLADAMRYGYEVEKEQLYYVNVIKGKNEYLNYNKGNHNYFISSNRQTPTVQTQFAEEEIKAIDPRYWQFAVPVEEVDAD